MKKLISFNIEVLNNILDITSQLNDEIWSHKVKSINNETIGRHCRHIIEFYKSFLDRADKNQINYDNRERDINTETNLEFAKTQLRNTILSLNTITRDKNIDVILNKSKLNSELKSSVKRELMYIADHAIHHGHIIQIAIQNEFSHLNINKYFYSPSTLESRQCAL